MLKRGKNIFKFSNWLICILIFSSCAQVVPITGGKKDITPPKVVKYIPDSAAINFKAKKIAIFFDEYVQLNDLNKQLTISPPLDKQPDITVKNKTLEIEFKESLKENTTYTIGFGSSLRDVNESNPLEDFKYVFSTGNFIDSLSLVCKVKNSITQKPEKDVLVMLYDSFEDSVPYKKRPNYFAKTKADGSCKIEHIKQGKYKAFALKDANSNYLYDSQEEEIAFVSEPITIDKKDSLVLQLFKEIPTKQFIKKSSVEGYGHLKFVFNKPSDKINISALNFSSKKQWQLPLWSKTLDTLDLWLLDVGVEELKLQISDNNKILDTLEMKLISREKFEKENGAKLLSNSPSTIDFNTPLVISFNHPLNEYSIDYNKQLKKNIYLKEDTIVLDSSKYYFEIKNEKILIHKIGEWKMGSTYQLVIKPKSFTDIFQIENDSVKVNFKTREEKYYGNVKLKFTTEFKKQYPIIIQLIDEKGAVISERPNPKENTIDFSFLTPQKYLLRIDLDENNNSKWDNGNYLKHIQPEKIIYNTAPINVRSNWDLETDWKISD